MIDKVDKSHNQYSKLKSVIIKLSKSPTKIYTCNFKPISVNQIEESKSNQSNFKSYTNSDYGSYPITSKKKINSVYNSYSSNKEFYNDSILRNLSKVESLEKKKNTIKKYKNNSQIDLLSSATKNSASSNNLNLTGKNMKNKEKPNKLSHTEFIISRQINREDIKTREFIEMAVDRFYNKSINSSFQKSSVFNNLRSITEKKKNLNNLKTQRISRQESSATRSTSKLG